MANRNAAKENRNNGQKPFYGVQRYVNGGGWLMRAEKFRRRFKQPHHSRDFPPRR